MELPEAIELLEDLMEKHGLFREGWSYGIDKVRNQSRKYRLLGSCHTEDKVIWLADTYVVRAHPSEVKETILHEIAHALVGPGHGHDAVWKACAKRIGSEGEEISYKPELPAVIPLGYEEKK